jgi:hypothetical protein
MNLLARRAAALALVLVPLFAAAEGPKRNLLVEWQLGEASSADEQDAAVVLRSDGSRTRAAVGVDTRSADRQRDGVQRLLVLNGASATLRLAHSQPWQFVQAAWAGGSASSPRQGVVLGTQWMESGQGLQVQPRWPGGAAPVTVELQAESAAAPLLPDGSTPRGDSVRQQVHTTLQLPMDQWVIVAESGEQRERAARGVLSADQARASTRQVLRLRISAP